MMNFGSVAITVSKIYDINVIWVNFCVTLFLISFVIFNFPSTIAIEKNIKWTFVMSAGAQTIGSWLRYFILLKTNNFYGLIFAQGIIASIGPFIGNMPSKLATIWFSDNERAMAIGSLSLPIGAIIGLAIGPFFIKSEDKLDHEKGYAAVNYYMLISAIVTTVMNIPSLLFFKSKP